MKMEMTGQLRLEQRMKLAPKMIQSMEVLQLPLLALQDKIDAELSSNPVLEIAQSDPDETTDTTDQQDISDSQGEKELVVSEDGNNADDFSRLDSLDEDFQESISQSTPMKVRQNTGESDKKLEAMQNTAAPKQSLHEYLTDQWHMIDSTNEIRTAGQLIIDYIDKKGFLSIQLEQLYNKDRSDFTPEDLYKALALVQTLEPTGIGARDVRECLLLQIDQCTENMYLERSIISEYYDLLLDNKLPEIAKRLKVDIDDITGVLHHLAKFDTSPGLQFNSDSNPPITADIIVDQDEDGNYSVKLTNAYIPNLKVNDFYSKMAKSKSVEDKTRQFLQQNIRSAQWLMDAIEQRQVTVLKVATAIVKHQIDFFEKGELYLRPLPMQKIADEVGVHIATVSRAVSGKYVQCSQGILALRSFFSGGTETHEGDTQSWNAIKAQLKQIIDEEDKSKPLNDDLIAEKLKDMGIKQIARRTVAKYRKLLNIPAARFRKKF